jgi:hypothetical protein
MAPTAVNIDHQFIAYGFLQSEDLGFPSARQPLKVKELDYLGSAHHPYDGIAIPNLTDCKIINIVLVVADSIIPLCEVEDISSTSAAARVSLARPTRVRSHGGPATRTAPSIAVMIPRGATAKRTESIHDVEKLCIRLVEQQQGIGIDSSYYELLSKAEVI